MRSLQVLIFLNSHYAVVASVLGSERATWGNRLTGDQIRHLREVVKEQKNLVSQDLGSTPSSSTGARSGSETPSGSTSSGSNRLSSSRVSHKHRALRREDARLRPTTQPQLQNNTLRLSQQTTTLPTEVEIRRSSHRKCVNCFRKLKPFPFNNNFNSFLDVIYRYTFCSNIGRTKHHQKVLWQ